MPHSSFTSTLQKRIVVNTFLLGWTQMVKPVYLSVLLTKCLLFITHKNCKQTPWTLLRNMKLLWKFSTAFFPPPPFPPLFSSLLLSAVFPNPRHISIFTWFLATLKGEEVLPPDFYPRAWLQAWVRSAISQTTRSWVLFFWGKRSSANGSSQGTQS